MVAFATPAELSQYTDGAIGANDPRAQLMLDGATRAIQRLAGWHISPAQDETAVLDGDGTHILHLETLRLNSVASITTPAGTENPDDYEWTRLGLIRRRTGRWQNRWNFYTVAFNHGFTEVPDLKQIVLQVSAMALSSPTGATREQAGQVAMQWATTAAGVSGGLSLLDRDLAVVASYKLPARL